MKVYVVTAYRWGDLEGHSYNIGVFTDVDVAIKEAKLEEEYRGGKYSCEVVEWEVDKTIHEKDWPIKNTVSKVIRNVCSKS